MLTSDYKFDACLLRIQMYQKLQIAWFKRGHKALVLIPNINELQIGALEHTQSTHARL